LLYRKMESDYSTFMDSAMAMGWSRISNMPLNELNAWIEDPSQMDAFIQELPQVKTLLSEKEMLIAQNRNAAEFNLNLGNPSLADAKESVLKAYEEAKKWKLQFEEKLASLNSAAEQRSLETTHALLQAAAAEAEDESDRVAQELLNGNISANDFVEAYRPKRVLAHMRKIKCEKLAELLATSDMAQHRKQ
ncbi:Vacuolar protein sorting-associated protein 37B, partial [Trichinella papuae]